MASTDAQATGGETRSDLGIEGAADPARASIDVPETASPEQAAAIVAAVGAHLGDCRAAAAAAAADCGAESWDGKQWSHASRLPCEDAVRPIPSGTPTDAWTVAGRAAHF